MVVRKPSHIAIVVAADAARIETPSARYAVQRSGEAHAGEWIALDAPLPAGWGDTFTEAEARLLLPFLRARANAGRSARAPTTADGRLIARAQRALGMTAAQLADAIGAHRSVLSRARDGALPEAHRDAIRKLIEAHAAQRPRTR